MTQDISSEELAGWCWAPTEPTHDMRIAGVEAWKDEEDGPPITAIYRAMLAAAPIRPEPPRSAAAVSGGWQDISTAPKDGTRLLVHDDAGACGVAWWNGRWWEDSFGALWDAVRWLPIPDPLSDGASTRVQAKASEESEGCAVCGDTTLTLNADGLCGHCAMEEGEQMGADSERGDS